MTHTSISSRFGRGLLRLVLPVFGMAVCGASACLTSPGEEGESGIRYGLTDTATVERKGVELIAWYESADSTFTGTVRNTTDETVRQVRVEIHLSNGVELGPTPRVDLASGETDSFQLDAGGHTFSWWTIHVEIGSDSG